jgi:hypothetical protein
MTIAQLDRLYKTTRAEFERAVKRRRRDLHNAMRNHLAARRVKNNYGAPAVLKQFHRVMQAMHRSVFDKVTDPKCKPWHQYKNGKWGCNSKQPSCRA